MKNSILILSFLFPLFLSAQNAKVQVVDKKEGNTTILIGKNGTDAEVELEVKLTSQGLGLPKVKTLKETIPANSEKEIIHLTPEAGKKWSYSFEYSFRPQVQPDLAEQPATAQHQLPPSDGKITVFTKNGCGRCAATVDYLKKNNIPFEEENTTRSKKSQELMQQKLFASGFKGGRFLTPVVVVGEEVFYNIENLQGFLEQLAEVGHK